MGWKEGKGEVGERGVDVPVASNDEYFLIDSEVLPIAASDICAYCAVFLS